MFATAASDRVPLSQELLRVRDLPRRKWSDEDAVELAREMSETLLVPGGERECGVCRPECITKLRPIQAVALYELGTQRGAFGPQRVGAGKTLVSLLAPVVTFAQRPLLIIPANLLGKTERDLVQLRRHWDLPRYLRIMTYEWLGRVQAAEALDRYAPDLIVLDESQHTKNTKAAVTRRLRRYFRARSDCVCLAMSGTITKRSLHDYAHHLRWCLRETQLPIPRHFSDLEAWARALDEKKDESDRPHPGALELLCDESERERFHFDPLGAARSAFRRRLVETVGVVSTAETPIDAALVVRGVEPGIAPAIDRAFEKLRSEAITPDGWALADGLQIFQQARELALGFSYTWVPRPAQYWYDARRAWAKFVREVLKHSRNLDTELQVRRAHPQQPELVEWERVKNHFQPETVPIWLDQGVARYCAEWARERSGIVWCEHVVLGEKLRDLGLAYYGKRGLDACGRPIEEHAPGEPMAASIASNMEGRNLQAWSQNLITSFPPTGSRAEQLIGRTHRDGQRADEVDFDVLCTCAEHAGGFWQAWRDARYIQDTTGSPQKLCLATIDFPDADDLALQVGARWRKNYGADRPIE